MHKGQMLNDLIVWSCPWCDKPTVILTEIGSSWQVRCNYCHTSGPACDKRFDAIKAWNCLSGRIATARK